LTIDNGNTVDFSSLDTDTQLDSAGVAALGFVAGPHTINTDTQNLSLAGAVLSIDNGNSVDLSSLGGAVSNDNDSTNEIQSLSFNNDTLSISDGNSVDLSSLRTENNDNDSTNELNTGANLSGTVLNIEDAGGTVSVDLASLLFDLQSQINELKTRVDTLESQLEECCNTTGKADIGATTDGPILFQNYPNPFNTSTRIEYYIPLGIENAKLQISDTKGQILKVVEIEDRGMGNTIFNSADFAVGQYYCTLLIDNEMHTTIKMIKD
jgi:hypothetical protein